jgi:dipeptidyl aminopeptidase/acylaminoacyl peptidase
MTTLGETAIATARRESADGTTFAPGLCLQRVRLCYGVDSKYPDAATAWLSATAKHPETHAAAIPRGAPVFWVGGSAGHGHIAIATGDGECWSTDILRNGHWDKVPIDLIHATWGLALVGWTEDLNGVHVYDPTQEGDMPLTQDDIDRIAKAVTSTPIVAADDNSVKRVLGFLYTRQMGIISALDALADGLDPAVQAAVKKALADGLVDVEVTVHDKTGA